MGSPKALDAVTMDHGSILAIGSPCDQLGVLTVRIADSNGPRSSSDRTGRIHLRLPRTPSLAVKATDSSAYAAIDRAAERGRGTNAGDGPAAAGGHIVRARRPRSPH